jgi:hypothetical protein
MTPVQVLLAARRAGIQLSVRDGQLVARPSSALDETLRAALKEHRDRLVELLLIPTATASPTVERLLWQARDHVCSTACTREHLTCNACGGPLRPHEQHWPHLHLNCRLELVD